VNEGVVEAVWQEVLGQKRLSEYIIDSHVRGEDVSDTEDQTILRLRAEVGDGGFLGLPDFGSLSRERAVTL
jgi:hypothetical protein